MGHFSNALRDFLDGSVEWPTVRYSDLSQLKTEAFTNDIQRYVRQMGTIIAQATTQGLL